MYWTDKLNEMLNVLSGVVWGPWLIVLLVGTGLYLTFRLRFLQIRGFGHALKCISGVYDDPSEKGDISHFQALCAALSATIGTGNIAGVATAIAYGGPGAVFWMWVTALVGMATKFTSCSLAVKYRRVHADGSASGGPMYYLRDGFKPKWLENLVGDSKVRSIGAGLGFLFALFTVFSSFGIGNMVQSNSVVDGLRFVVPEAWSGPAFTWMGFFEVKIFNLIVGLFLAGLVAMVILGGIKRIGRVATAIVPVMCCVYLLGAIVILLFNLKEIPSAFLLIFKQAFSNTQAMAGGFAGAVLARTIRFGVARGVFSNESGLGSAPMAHAAAKTREPIREGYVAMLGPFIDTILVCSMTALVIIVTGSWMEASAEKELVGAALSCHAFQKGLHFGDFTLGHIVVAFGLVFFAYSTILSWSYYGDRCAEYLLGPRAIRPYRILYCIAVVLGATGALKMIWTIADILNGLMAVPNLIALIALGGWVVRGIKEYKRRVLISQ